MCGRFAQYRSRNAYFDALGIEDDELIYDPEPVARYNVAPGTRVLLLNMRDEHLHLDPVFWGYGPEWWHKQPLINARSETAPTGRMFKPLWHHGRAVVPADGWFEWKKRVTTNSPILSITSSKSRFSSPPLVKRPSIKITAMRALSSLPRPATKAWWIFTTAARWCCALMR